ncbi:MAG: chromate transporter [Tepidimonas sp.]|nr:chromate transporter [Tepidimonas sp.]
MSAWTAGDWLGLFTHFLSLSLLAIGGALTTAADMHRYLVHEHAWISDTQFTAAIALAHAAPGPNILFVALLGWYVGLNAASPGASAWWVGLQGVAVCLGAMLLPSSLLTYSVTRWLYRRRDWWPVQALQHGLAPVVVALLLSSGWLLARSGAEGPQAWRLWLLTAATAALVWRTRLPLLGLLALGALLGALGWL